MWTKTLFLLCAFLRVSQLQAQTETNTAPPEVPSMADRIAETGTATTEPRWTTYYTSTNQYAGYLDRDFTYQSAVSLPDPLQTRLCDFFRKEYRDTYNIFHHQTSEEDAIYDLINKVYDSQELFSVFHEYLEILTELEKMGSHILIHDIDFKKVDVKSYAKKLLTVEAVWSVHGTVRHLTHDHEQKNANCVQFKVSVDTQNGLKIKSSKVMAIDRFDLYQ